jgi:glycosyltransferase 2 family protein
VNSRLLIRLLVLVLFCVAAAWTLSHVDWAELRGRVLGASLIHLALMSMVWIGALFLRPLRFLFLLHSLGQGRRARYVEIWAATTLGMAVNSFTAMRAGDVVVTLLLRHRLGIDIHRSLTVIVADALCDFVFVAILFLTALSFAPRTAGWTVHAAPVLGLAIALIIIGLGLVVWLRRGLLALADRVLGRLRAPWSKRLREIAEDVLAGASAIAHWRVFVPLVVISGAIWAVIGLSYWLGLRAVYIEPSAALASFTMAAVTLSFIVPLGPGGLGAFEAAAVIALSLFGVRLEAAIAFAILAHALQLGSALLLAAIAVATQGIDYRALLLAAKKPQAGGDASP